MTRTPTLPCSASWSLTWSERPAAPQHTIRTGIAHTTPNKSCLTGVSGCLLIHLRGLFETLKKSMLTLANMICKLTWQSKEAPLTLPSLPLQACIPRGQSGIWRSDQRIRPSDSRIATDFRCEAAPLSPTFSCHSSSPPGNSQPVVHGRQPASPKSTAGGLG